MDGKQGQDQALNLADFKIDDMLSVPGDHLLAETFPDGMPRQLTSEP